MMLLLLVPDIQSSQPYWVCQNIILVNKWMAKYQYKLSDIRHYVVEFRRAKYLSMLVLGAGFQNIPLEHALSYDSTFVIQRSSHRIKGKFQWLRIPMSVA